VVPTVFPNSQEIFTFSSVPAGAYVAVSGVDANGDGVFGDAPNEAMTISGWTPTVVVGSLPSNGIKLQVRNELDDFQN
jgi:hypothetical protein